MQYADPISLHWLYDDSLVHPSHLQLYFALTALPSLQVSTSYHDFQSSLLISSPTMPPKKSSKAAATSAPENRADDQVQDAGQPQEQQQEQEVKKQEDDVKEEDTPATNGDKPKNAPAGDVNPEEEQTKTDDKTETKQIKGAKRKAPPTSTSSTAKAPRRGRSSAAHTSSVEPAKLVSFLLSSRCAELVRAKDEREHLEAHPDHLTYTSNTPLSPFGELMSALLLSRPISHALGHRSIRTLMNEPWSYTSPNAILNPKHKPETLPRDGEAARIAAESGGEPAHVMHSALEEARTQHKAKTASQLVGLANVCAEDFCEDGDDVEMKKLLKHITDAGDDAGKALEDAVKSKVKGMGQTGAEIFRRRVQGVAGWEVVGPFVDGRTKNVLEKLGLSGEAEDVMKLVEETVEEKEKWKTFVKVLERAVEADLQGVVDEVLEQAAGEKEVEVKDE